MNVDIAEGHERCASCSAGLEQGEQYVPMPAGTVQWRPEANADPLLEVWCRDCARQVAA